MATIVAAANVIFAAANVIFAAANVIGAAVNVIVAAVNVIAAAANVIAAAANVIAAAANAIAAAVVVVAAAVIVAAVVKDASSFSLCVCLFVCLFVFAGFCPRGARVGSFHRGFPFFLIRPLRERVGVRGPVSRIVCQSRLISYDRNTLQPQE